MSDISKKLDDIIQRLDKIDSVINSVSEPFYVIFDVKGYCNCIEHKSIAYQIFNSCFSDGYVFLYDDNFSIDISLLHSNVQNPDFIFNNMLNSLRSFLYLMSVKRPSDFDVISVLKPTKLYFFISF